jgi:hypothetical protein
MHSQIAGTLILSTLQMINGNKLVYEFVSFSFHLIS